MVAGEKRTLWMPAALSARARPGGPPPPDVTMVIELIDIIAGPKTPADVKAPPRTLPSRRTASRRRCSRRDRHRSSDAYQQRVGQLCGVDDRRQDVRFIILEGRARDVRGEQRDSRLDGSAPADGGRRKASRVDPRGAGLQRSTGASARDARFRRRARENKRCPPAADVPGWAARDGNGAAAGDGPASGNGADAGPTRPTRTERFAADPVGDRQGS